MTGSEAPVAAWLRSARLDGAFPLASAAVGTGREVLVRVDEPRLVEGRLRLYDLASLTKVMATAMVALRLVDRGELSLHDTLEGCADVPPAWRSVSIGQLLTHTAGFEAHVMLCDLVPAGDGPLLDRAVACLLARPPAYVPGTRVVYSCLGFIVLQYVLERAAGAGLDDLASELVFAPLEMTSTGFRPTARGECALHIAATEIDPATNRRVHGEVHDENARFLGGVAGNAGLFSTCDDCARFAGMLVRRGDGFLSRELFDEMVSDRTPELDAARGLGVSVARPGADWAAGTRLGIGAFGHTGFTGTSLYVSPTLGAYFVLLSNRVYLGRDLEAVPDYRAAYHDAAVAELDGRRT
ncbi:MAG: serine hydrolase domain-containing protein [Spirochaetota bacterium]